MLTSSWRLSRRIACHHSPTVHRTVCHLITVSSLFIRAIYSGRISNSTLRFVSCTFSLNVLGTSLKFYLKIYQECTVKPSETARTINMLSNKHRETCKSKIFTNIFVKYGSIEYCSLISCTLSRADELIGVRYITETLFASSSVRTFCRVYLPTVVISVD